MSNVIIKKAMEQIAMKIAEQWGLLPEYMATRLRGYDIISSLEEWDLPVKDYLVMCEMNK